MTFKRTKISRYFTLRERKKLNLSELTPQAAVMILKDDTHKKKLWYTAVFV